MKPIVTRTPSLTHWGAFTAVTENNRLLRCEPFALDPNPSGILQSMPEMIHSSHRIGRPAIRSSWLKKRHLATGVGRGTDSFVEVSWDLALSLITEELQRVRTDHGNETIFGGSYGWSSAGRLHHARSLTHRFLFTGGGCTTQQGNYSWGCAQFFLPHIIGDYNAVTGRVTDWNSVCSHTQLMIAFGGFPLKNTQITSGGAGEHNTKKHLMEAQEAGVEFVVISPNQKDIPDGLEARWIPIVPNTDTALMLAMMYILLKENLVNTEFLSTHCHGSQALISYLLGHSDHTPKTPEWAEEICGVAAETILWLTKRSAAKRTLLTCAWSLQRAHRGEQPYWASISLASFLGQIGLPGGGFSFGHASMNGVGNPRPHEPAAPQLTIPRNPTQQSIPVARFTDMILNPGQEYEFNGQTKTYPDTKLIYWAGGNPYHHQQDLNKLNKAWQKPETIIVHENWWTPTALRADIVLPATVTLERNDIGGSSRDRFVFAAKQALTPYQQSRSDFDIYAELAQRNSEDHFLAFTEGRDEMAWVQFIYQEMATQWNQHGIDTPSFEDFWEQGYLALPIPEKEFVLLEAFRNDPVANPLKTPSGKIELYSEKIASFHYEDCPPHASWLAPVEWLGSSKAQAHPLHLLTPQPADKLHSQFDPSSLSQKEKINARSILCMHPHDAKNRGLKNHDLVRVFNERGACLAGVQYEENLKPGVITISTGAWFDPLDDTLELHGNPNVLTKDIGTSQLTQASSAQSTLVEVQAWQQELAPEVRVFKGPEFKDLIYELRD